ncbi:hypothetical protein ALP05_200188 [Pseudomonas caricapapayae]|uniref:Uncharacterized protein n=1 Tax=Pseudomonas caricapapayae TaxID=46678 RepID=A0A3M6ERX1_9PSED|nr:hypothetical protein ALP05_200188 [Pseudomonas caricapapayae]
MSGIVIGIFLILSLNSSPGGRAQSIVDLPCLGLKSHTILISGYLVFDLINSVVALIVSRVYLGLDPLVFDWATAVAVLFYVTFAAISLYKAFMGAPVKPHFGVSHGFPCIITRSLKNYGLWFDALFPLPLLISFFEKSGSQPWMVFAGMMLGYVGWYLFLVGAVSTEATSHNLMWFAATCIMVLIDCVLISMMLCCY